LFDSISRLQNTMATQVQVLRELGGGWLQCQDSQGVFFYNNVTQQSSVELPNDLRAQQQQQQQQQQHQQLPQAAAATPQVQVLRELAGGWLHVQDAQGPFYYNQRTQQSSDEYPVELRAPAQPSAPMQSQSSAYAQQAQLQQGPPANQAKLKQQLGDWMICEDAQGEFYMNARTQQSYDQPPAELVQLYRASQQQKQNAAQVVTQQQSPAAQQQMGAQQQMPAPQYQQQLQQQCRQQQQYSQYR